MADIVWACWDGGGNLNPSIGIAHELQARGHRVRFLIPDTGPRHG